MTVEDAAEAVVAWLSTQAGTFAPEMFGRELGPSHFRVGIVQVTPETKQRVFELIPLDCEDCYEVRELEAT